MSTDSRIAVFIGLFITILIGVVWFLSSQDGAQHPQHPLTTEQILIDVERCQRNNATVEVYTDGRHRPTMVLCLIRISYEQGVE